VTHLVAEVERDLGRQAAAFNLQIDVLPVEGVWGSRARVDHVLVSRELHGDHAAFRAFLTPRHRKPRVVPGRSCQASGLLKRRCRSWSGLYISASY
jgi:hypothetical protein